MNGCGRDPGTNSAEAGQHLPLLVPLYHSLQRSEHSDPVWAQVPLGTIPHLYQIPFSPSSLNLKPRNIQKMTLEPEGVRAPGLSVW